MQTLYITKMEEFYLRQFSPKNGNNSATNNVEKTRTVLINKATKWDCSVKGKSSSRLRATGVIVNAYFERGFTTYKPKTNPQLVIGKWFVKNN